jgi:hypothetical protein
VIPELTAWAESPGVAAALVPLALAGLLTVILLFVQSVGEIFCDQDS